VVQVIVAPVFVAVTATFEITGVPVVVNELLADVADVFAALADTTSKS
jgi:hypothetical protein